MKGIGAGVAVLLVLGGFGTLAAQQFAEADPPPEPTVVVTTTDPAVTTATTTPATPPTEPATEEPDPVASQVGIVQISSPVPDAERVATMFDAYFTAINAKDYEAVLALYDPNGVLDTTDGSKAQQFVDDISTTQDDQVVLGDVSSNGGTVSADLTFRSRQAAGKGPRASPNQTCTIWSLRYTITDDAGDLLIKKSTGGYQPC